LAVQDRKCVLRLRREAVELEVVEQDLERIADPAELTAVAADLVEDRLFHVGVRCLAEIDVDAPELRPLLIERPWIDRLPQLARCERELERLGHPTSSC
jgi:hypothetical protein